MDEKVAAALKRIPLFEGLDPASAACERLGRGEILNASLIILLQWLAQNRARLKKLWP